MRQWNVDPKLLCRQHLFGEHVEDVNFVEKGLRMSDLITLIEQIIK